MLSAGKEARVIQDEWIEEEGKTEEVSGERGKDEGGCVEDEERLSGV